MATETWTPNPITPETWTQDGEAPPVIAPPVNVTPPFITGAAEIGAILTHTVGNYIDAVTIAHVWNIDGVPTAFTGPTFVGVEGAISVTETATNTGGSISVASNIIVVGYAPEADFGEPRNSWLVPLLEDF